MGVIYKITSPSNKLYVGQTYDLRKRINAHKCATKYGKNIMLHNSIRKYGWDAHKLEVIEEVDDSMLDEREIFWIAELKTYCYENPLGMNMTKGGLGHRSTWMHKTKLREWFSEKFSGDGNPFYGKKHTKETKEKLSKIAKERNLKEGRKVPEWGAEKGRESVRKKVICYNIEGNFLSEYKSLSDAATKLNVSLNGVQSSCSGRITGVAGKYTFRYKKEDYPLKIEVSIKPKTVKRPVLTMDEDYNIVCEHESAQEASEFWGIPKTTINRASMYNWLMPIRTGHVFIYKDLYEEILAVESAV